jgi:hypothetical protein
MGVIVRISKNDKPEDAVKALNDFAKKSRKRKGKSLSDFYGKLAGAFGDGLSYQKKIRNEWQ